MIITIANQDYETTTDNLQLLIDCYLDDNCYQDDNNDYLLCKKYRFTTITNIPVIDLERLIAIL